MRRTSGTSSARRGKPAAMACAAAGTGRGVGEVADIRQAYAGAGRRIFGTMAGAAHGRAGRRGNSILARKQASWRSAPPSEGQINYARRLGVLRDGMTKGQVAEAITCKLALDAVARKERTVGWL